MLQNLNPHSLAAAHVMFERDVRRIRWGMSAERVQRVSVKWLLVVMGVFVALWLLVVIPVIDAPPHPQSGFLPALDDSLDFIVILGLASIGANVLLDFVSLWVSMNSIGSEVSAGRWDLMRLTSLHERDIVMAKYGAAQLRAWRFTMVVLAARIAVVVLALLHTFVLPIFVRGYPVGIGIGIGGTDYLVIAIFVIVITLYGFIYLAEAVWRMQTLTALGVWVSTHTHSVVYAVLMSFGVMLMVWITQVMMIGGLIFVGGHVVTMLTDFGYAGGIVFNLLAPTATAVAIFFYYRQTRRWALNRATRRVFIAD